MSCLNIPAVIRRELSVKSVVLSFFTVNVQDYIALSAADIYLLFAQAVERYGTNLFYS